jgi:glutamate-1-semialdehyde 2,1-aminomutase
VKTLDRARLITLMGRELAAFAERHPRSRALHERARTSLLDGVPMNWMIKWAGGFPLFVDSAQGARFTDVEGHEYVDFCLGDTGAMAGHAPEATARAVRAQLARGITHMLPTEDAIVVGDELRRRFGLRYWQFTLTATDANRFSIRLARHITGRPKVVVHDHNYHGTVDETFAWLADGRVEARRGNLGPPVDPALTTKVVEFNDLDALEEALSEGDVAAVLMEPALTNVGIVLPEPGYHESVREICTRHGTLLINDETHTFCAGPGGYTGAHHLAPDMLTIGKAIGGGIPSGAYAFSEAVGDRIRESITWDDADVGGIGGTLAGNALSFAAMRATLTEVLTDDAFTHMAALAERWTAGVESALGAHSVPWHVTRLGCRAEYHFMPAPPRTGAEQWANGDVDLERFLHLYVMNRGILMTPFHNMALMSPATTATDVDRHTEVFGQALAELFA